MVFVPRLSLKNPFALIALRMAVEFKKTPQDPDPARSETEVAASNAYQYSRGLDADQRYDFLKCRLLYLLQRSFGYDGLHDRVAARILIHYQDEDGQHSESLSDLVETMNDLNRILPMLNAELCKAVDGRANPLTWSGYRLSRSYPS